MHDFNCGACAGFRQLHGHLQDMAACNLQTRLSAACNKSASVPLFPIKRRLLVPPGGKAQASDVSAFDSLIAAHVPGPVGTNPRASCADGLSAGLYRMHFLMNLSHSGTSGAIVLMANPESLLNSSHLG